MTFELQPPKSNLGCILISCTFIPNLMKIHQTLLKLSNGNQCYGRTDGRTTAFLYPLPTSSGEGIIKGENNFLPFSFLITFLTNEWKINVQKVSRIRRIYLQNLCKAWYSLKLQWFFIHDLSLQHCLTFKQFLTNLFKVAKYWHWTHETSLTISSWVNVL